VCSRGVRAPDRVVKVAALDAKNKLLAVARLAR
jgi:hypothetical protein